MLFGASDTYIYAYIVFACVYLVASFTFVASALRVSTGLSRARQSSAAVTGPTNGTVASVLSHGQRLIDYTQLSTLLPLVYIVGSMFLGSVIVRNTDLARTVNIAWIVFTVACAAASILLTVLGIRESGAIGGVSDLPERLAGRAPEALQRIGLRLGVSAALLLLVAVFTLLNLWSVISSVDTLSAVDFLL
jgi:quinol-cytochrome oxidoreductase complex cytochrome b subunit